ncbi:MAG TPA: hypothetical protein VHE54_17665 [Puia sp.]|nr:hypothetical protein [Puia sp.]
MKNSQWVGVAGAFIVIAASFMPWAFYPDLQKEFTGFFSEQNIYGRPGKILIFFAVIDIVLFLIPRVWAKRANILVAAMAFAFGVKSYMLYTACYRGICPERRAGIFLVLGGTAIVLVASLLPDLPVKENRRGEKEGQAKKK